MRDGFGFSVDEKFVGIAAARFAIERGAPLAKDFFEFFLMVGGELLDGFDAEGAESAFGDFADAWNFANWQRGEKASFHTGSNPHEAARLCLIGGDLGDKARGGESAGTGKSSVLVMVRRSLSAAAKGGPWRRSVPARSR